MNRTRIAPTPSGFLHAGNLRNFEITRDLAQRFGLEIALRIDDADASRYRREFVDDIFRALERLGVTWDLGPVDADDFEVHWSQRRKTDYYREQLELLRTSDLETYACSCSRSMLTHLPSGGCPGGCRNAGLDLRAEATALRVHVPLGTIVTVGEVEVDLAAVMGDFVVWRRDDLPAYQLVSVIEDRDLGISHIVRGEDLLPSTAAQIFLAPAVDAPNVVQASYLHHELVTDASGVKLSKSRSPQ